MDDKYKHLEGMLPSLDALIGGFVAGNFSHHSFDMEYYAKDRTTGDIVSNAFKIGIFSMSGAMFWERLLKIASTPEGIKKIYDFLTENEE